MRQILAFSLVASSLAAVAVATSTGASAQVSSWNEYRAQAASRIMAFNQGITFEGEPPPVLASIPVLQVDLEEDGSIAGITVVREPQNVPETMQMAMDAIMRAAPFGSVAHLPRPWVFTETFLYDESLRFQLRSRQR